MMKKHIYILSLVLSLSILISCLIAGKDLVTILGWFTATMSTFTTLLFFLGREIDKED